MKPHLKKPIELVMKGKFDQFFNKILDSVNETRGRKRKLKVEFGSILDLIENSVIPKWVQYITLKTDRK